MTIPDTLRPPLKKAFAATLLVLLLAPRAALAQSDFDRATARVLAQEGHEALDHNDYATAADRFGRAAALVHAPTLLLGLAQVQYGLGRWVSALETYNRIVREGLPAKASPPFVAALEQAQKERDALSRRIPTVTIEAPGPASVKVTIDGVDVPSAALGVKRPIDPGEHVIRAAAEGFLPSETKRTIGEGAAERVTLELKPSAEPAPGAPLPPPQPAVPPSAGPSQTGSGDAGRLSAAPQEGARTRRLLGVVGLAAGGAGLAVGAATGAAVIVKHGELLKSCPGGHCRAGTQPQVGPQLDTYHQLSTASTIGFVAGGVLAATGLVLFITAPAAATDRSQGAIAPVLGLGWAGIEGRFR
jgi:hypothetical protein